MSKIMKEVIHLKTFSCSYCGRNFSEEALGRHEGICAKTSQKTKKYVYDSSKVRSAESGIPSYSSKSNYSSNSSSKQTKKQTLKREQQALGKKNNWRQQHEDLVRSLRAARQVSQAIKAGKPLPPPLPPAENPDYITCDYCGRRFGESAAERHIEFCKGQHERLPKGRGNTIAAQKQATRINYKPPVLKSRKAVPSGYSDNNLSRLKPSSDNHSNPSYSFHEDSSNGPKRSPKSNAATSMRQQRPVVAARPSNSKPQSLSQSYLDTPAANDLLSGDNRMVGRGRASFNRSLVRPNDPPSPGVGRMQASSSYNSHLNEQPKFCSECGCKYPTSTSKFCCECGCPKGY